MEQEQQNIDSLFDFLYIDRVRVSSLTAQLHNAGVVTSVKQTISDTDKSNKSVELNVKILKGKIGADDSIAHSQEKTFDASWSLPINFLDKLDEVGMIKTGLNGENLGSVVHSIGKMRIFDVSTIQKIMPLFGEMAQAQANTANLPPKVKAKLKGKLDIDEIEVSPGLKFGVVKKLINIVPNILQVDFIDEDGELMWMSIDKEFLTINPDDLALKYGGTIPGTWHVIGLIDALPDYVQGKDIDSSPAFPEHDLKSGLQTFLDMVKEQAGRGSNSYGMTPLLIFRTVG
ncbi:DUF6414 family protein [Citrobacter werkmanii]